jgi:hypothetical protein
MLHPAKVKIDQTVQNPLILRILRFRSPACRAISPPSSPPSQGAASQP